MFEAYRKLDSFDDSRPLSPWLFRIAHNRCIDFLRRRDVREKAEAMALEADAVSPDRSAWSAARPRRRTPGRQPSAEGASVRAPQGRIRLFARRDRATGRLHRRRRQGRAQPRPEQIVDAARRAGSESRRRARRLLELLRLYVERFNRRDWDGVRELTSADARLRVADCFAGRLANSPYFVEYERPIVPWRMALGEVDGETAVIILRDDLRGADAVLVRSRRSGEMAASFALPTYIKCPWVLEAAASVTIGA